MDRRQRKSRTAIFTAFNSLLGQKAYSSITVQEIIDLADVGRTTFYSHFPTKDDLLRELSAEILDHVFSDSLEKESTHDFSTGDIDCEKLVLHILFHIRDNSFNIMRILTSDCSVIFLKYFRERLSRYLSGRIEIRHGIVPESYAIYVFSGGVISTIEWWCAGGMCERPESLASFFSLMLGDSGSLHQ